MYILLIKSHWLIIRKFLQSQYVYITFNINRILFEEGKTYL